MVQKPGAIRTALVEAILRGDYGREAPRIPREEDLADAFDVARGTVRSAIQDLQAHGIVKVTHGRPGAEVRPPREWTLFDPDLLEAVVDGPAGGEALAEALECRLLVAPEAAALAAERATAEELDALERHLERVRGAAGRPQVGARPAPELEFHRGVVEAAHNRFLARVAVPLEAVIASRSRRVRDAVQHQERILAAIRARDPVAAREAMRVRVTALVPSARRRGRG